MFKKLLEKLKRIWCSMKCCFESKCSLDATDTDGDGIPDEINLNLDNVINKLKYNLDENQRRKSF